jgi:hypothetical protein
MEAGGEGGGADIRIRTLIQIIGFDQIFLCDTPSPPPCMEAGGEGVNVT